MHAPVFLHRPTMTYSFQLNSVVFLEVFLLRVWQSLARTRTPLSRVRPACLQNPLLVLARATLVWLQVSPCLSLSLPPSLSLSLSRSLHIYIYIIIYICIYLLFLLLLLHVPICTHVYIYIYMYTCRYVMYLQIEREREREGRATDIAYGVVDSIRILRWYVPSVLFCKSENEAHSYFVCKHS